MPTNEMSAADEEALVVEWIEAKIGPIRTISRQGRWRPAWFVEVDDDGETVPLYVRGARGARFPPMPLSYEGEVQKLLAEEGVRVSKLYGYVEGLPALVMEQLRGRPNIATADSD